MKFLTEEVRSAIIRCMTSELYVDAPLAEIAEACETSVFFVQSVLDDMRLRRVLTHARMVSEQLELGLDDQPEAVITLALEKLYESAPVEPRQRRDMRWLLKRIA